MRWSDQPVANTTGAAESVSAFSMLFAILDWIMRLTPALDQQLWQDIHVIK